MHNKYVIIEGFCIRGPNTLIITRRDPEFWERLTNSVYLSLQYNYVCMYVIFIRCDKRTSNNKHKKQSQNDVQYKAAKPKKL